MMREIVSVQLALFKERVTWPHFWTQGRSVHGSTREGWFVGRMMRGPGVVYHRGSEYRVPMDRIRGKGKVTALTEIVLGRVTEPRR